MTGLEDWPVYPSEAVCEWIGLGKRRRKVLNCYVIVELNLLTQKPEDSIQKIRIPQKPVPWGLLLSLVSTFMIQAACEGSVSFLSTYSTAVAVESHSGCVNLTLGFSSLH